MDTDTPDNPPGLDSHPVYGLSDRVTNLVVHAGDTIVIHHYDNGLDEYLFFDQNRVHYATLSGHRVDPHDPGFPGEPSNPFVIDAIGYHPAPDGGRKLLPVRTVPNPYVHPGTFSGGNSITITQPPYTYTGDSPIPAPHPTPATSLGDRPVVTISHEHEHPHTRDDDALAFAYRHSHTHEHTGPSGNVWINEHAREAHDHPHTDPHDHEHDEHGG